MEEITITVTTARACLHALGELPLKISAAAFNEIMQKLQALPPPPPAAAA